MFTGIIEQVAKVIRLSQEDSNLRLRVKSSLTSELKIDQSVAHNGVCLTVVAIENDEYEVVAVEETLQKSNLGQLHEGDSINMERCMQMNARLDGHIVQGHVDEKAKLIEVLDQNGSWKFSFELQNPSKLIVEKGSICVNGVSLTAFDITERGFSIAVIPYTFEHTNFQYLKPGQEVNIEFDIIGKYVERMIGARKLP